MPLAAPPPGRGDARPARPSAPGGRDDVTTPRPGPGPVRESSRLSSNEELPPVSQRGLVHLRPGAEAERSPRPRELRAAPLAACGLEGALQEPGSAGRAGCEGNRSRGSHWLHGNYRASPQGSEPQASTCALPPRSALLYAVRRHSLRPSSQPPEGSNCRYY